MDEICWPAEWMRLRVWTRSRRHWWNRWLPLSRDEVKEYVRLNPELPRIRL